MKKAISVILFIIVAKVCDAQFELPKTTQTIPPSIWVIDSQSVQLSVPMLRVTLDSTHTVIDRWFGNFNGFQVFQVEDTPAYVPFGLARSKGYPITLKQCDSIMKSRQNQ